MTIGLQNEAGGGTHHAEINNAPHRISTYIDRHGSCDKCRAPRKDARGCKLHHCKQSHTLAAYILRRCNYMQREKQTAAKRKQIAHVNAVVVLQRYETNTRKAHHSRDEVINIRALFLYYPIDERHKHTIGCC